MSADSGGRVLQPVESGGRVGQAAELVDGVERVFEGYGDEYEGFV